MIKYKGDFYFPKSRDASPFQDADNNPYTDEYLDNIDSKMINTQVFNHNEPALSGTFDNANGFGG